MIPPACNLAVTFTAWRGGGGVEPVECQGHPPQIGHRRHCERKQRRNGSLGGRRRGEQECGRKWAGGLKKSERSGGKRAQMRGEKDKRREATNIQKRRWAWFVKGEIWPISSYWWGKWRLFFFFTDFGGPLGKVETTGTAPWPPNKLQPPPPKKRARNQTSVYAHPYTQFPSFVGSAAKVLTPCSAVDAFISPLCTAVP